MVIVALVPMVTGSRVVEEVAEVFGMRALFVSLLAWLRFPVALVLLWAALAVIYRYSPSVTQPLRSVMLGAALAVVSWAVASVGFSFYLAKFANFGVTYGSLGAAVGLLVYLNMSASIVLAGAELNATIHLRPRTRMRTRKDGPRRKDQRCLSSVGLDDGRWFVLHGDLTSKGSGGKMSERRAGERRAGGYG